MAVLRKVLEVAADHGAARVTRVSVRLGARSHFTPGHFREHFAIVAAGTPAAGAVIVAEVDSDENQPHADSVVLESVEVDD